MLQISSLPLLGQRVPGGAAGLRHWQRFLGRSRGPHAPAEEVGGFLPRLSSDLRQSCAAVESRFLDLGDRLQRLHADTLALSNRIVQAVRILDSDDGGLLDELRALIQDALVALATARQRAVAKIDGLARIAERVEALRRLCEEASDIAFYLTVVGFNIRIHSARSERFEATFAVIARESRNFSMKITEIVGRVQEDTERIVASGLGALDAVRHDLGAMQTLADEAQQLVTEAFDRIDALLALAGETLGQAGEQSRMVSDRVAEVVIALQLHDSISQRIGHIGAAMEEAVNRLAAGAGDPKERCGAMHAVLDLQAAQLDQIVHELRQAHHDTITAFRDIGAAVQDLGTGLERLASPEQDPGGVSGATNEEKGAFHGLKAALANLGMILDRGDRILAGISGTAQKAAVAARRLQEHTVQVEAISFETRLIALNAIVNAAHLGAEGSVFEVLANELTVLAQRSDRFVAAVAEIIETIDQLGRDLAVETGDTVDSARLAASLHRTEERYQAFEAEAGRLRGLAQALAGDIEAAATATGFLPEFADTLAERLERLTRLRERLAPWQGRGGELLGDHSEGLIQRYTMEQERSVHRQRLVSGSTAPTAGTAVEPLGTRPAAEPETGSEDLDDNVELF